MNWDKKEISRRPLIIPSIALLLGILLEERVLGLYIVMEHPILGILPIIGCFLFILLGKFEFEQKIAIIVLSVGMISVFLSILSLEWRQKDLDEGDLVVRGQIIRVEKLDDRTELVLDTEDGRILTRIYEASDLVDYGILGKEIEIVIDLEAPKQAGNPGGFDYRKYLYGRGIYGYGNIRASDIKEISGNASIIYRFTSSLLCARESFLNSFRDEAARDFAGGILFGMGPNISEDIRDDFMQGGAGHILAVSGLHIGIIYSAYKALEKKIKIKDIFIKKLIVLIVFFIYGTVSLWSVSVTRAIMMILLKEMAGVLNHRFDHLSALVLVSDFMLITRPFLAFSTGFQMSFLAMLGIFFLKPKVMYLLKKHATKHFKKKDISEDVLSAVSTMVSVQLLLIPYTIYVYNRFALFSLINNWILIALAGVYVPLGVALFFFFLISSLLLPGGEPVALFLDYLSVSLSILGTWMVDINKALLMSGDSVLGIISPRLYLVFGLFGGLLFYASEEYKVKRKRSRRRAIFQMLIFISFSILVAISISFNPVEMSDAVFLDVGQGDSLHLHWDDMDILVDGGGSTSYNVGEKILKPYLMHLGIRDIDMAISTHEHTDHFLGIQELAEVYEIKEIVSRGVAGDRIVLDDERYIEILWPLPGYEDSDDENYYSRVFKVSDRGITILVTGDITEEGEKALINHYKNGELKSHILKVAHHGSRFSTTTEFLEAVNPVIAVISVGKNNYGHPAPSVIEKLQSQGIIVYRTDRDGAIGIIIGEGKFFVCGNRRNMRIEEYRVP